MTNPARHNPVRDYRTTHGSISTLPPTVTSFTYYQPKRGLKTPVKEVREAVVDHVNRGKVASTAIGRANLHLSLCQLKM
jgi:hypothetical protein